jgi:hypothetical protein
VLGTDAFNLTVIANLIRKELAALVNVKLWQRSLSTEDRTALLGKVAKMGPVRNMFRGWGARHDRASVCRTSAVRRMVPHYAEYGIPTSI